MNERAGVAVPTVYASVGGKRELLLELRRASIASPERDRGLELLGAATDPEQALRGVVAGGRALVERFSPVLQVAAQARSVPEAFAYWEQGLASTREVCAATARRLAELDGLRSDLDFARATTTLSALIHPGTCSSTSSGSPGMRRRPGSPRAACGCCCAESVLRPPRQRHHDGAAARVQACWCVRADLVDISQRGPPAR